MYIQYPKVFINTAEAIFQYTLQTEQITSVRTVPLLSTITIIIIIIIIIIILTIIMTINS